MTGLKTHDATYLKSTRSTCPRCLKLVDTDVLVRENRVYFRKRCPDHGPSENLVSSDASWYLDSYRYAKPGWIPRKFQTESRRGCPHDCGLCPEHLQHSCLPIVEISDRCDMACPVCIVGAGGPRPPDRADMTSAEFEGILDALLESEPFVAILSLGGGEPTVHPEFLDFLDRAKARRPRIGRVSVSSNGLRMADDPAFCAEIARRGAYVSLQFDGFSDEAYTTLRGRPMVEIKERALANLKAAGVPVTLAMTVARGVNEDQIGAVVDRLCADDEILSLMLQPVAYTGHAGRGGLPHDPMDVVTLPEVLDRMEAQTEGRVKKSDFTPLPCPHTNCFCLSYLLKLDDGSTVPFTRFVDMKNYLEVIANRPTLEVDEKLSETMEETIYRLYSTGGMLPDSGRILSAIKSVLNELYPQGQTAPDRARIAEKRTKSIFVHAFMDRWTFDLERVRKCCDQYPQRDARMVPCCVHNVLHRELAEGDEG